MSYLLNKFVVQVYDSDLHITIWDYRTYLAGKDFGVSLITASKMCRAQLWQEKEFSAVLISHLTWEGESLSSSTEDFPELFPESNPAQEKDLQYFGSDQLQHAGILDTVPDKTSGHWRKRAKQAQKRGVAQSIDSWLSNLRCCIKLVIWLTERKILSSFTGKRSRNEKNNIEKLKIIISKR